MELIMMCGIPCSGKSTYIRRGVENSDMLDEYVILSTDDYIEEYAKANNKTYNEVFDDVIGEATTKMHKDLELAIQRGKSIIWDQTNVSKKSRKQKLKKIPGEYTKTAVVLPITLEEAIIRNSQRANKFIPRSVITRMYNQFEIPTEDEGFDVIMTHDGSHLKLQVA
jgi:predicted kinase